MSQRLERSRRERMIAGVSGGIAEYLEIDPTWVRLAFVLLALFGGIGLVAYVVLVVIMPLPAEPAVLAAGQASALAPGDSAAAAAPPARAPRAPADPAEMERRRRWAGYVLVAVGVVFLLGNAGLFRWIDWRTAWPLAIVTVGVLLLVQRGRRP